MKRDLVNLAHVIIMVHVMRQAVLTVHSVNLAMHVEVVSDMNVMLVLTVTDLLVSKWCYFILLCYPLYKRGVLVF